MQTRCWKDPGVTSESPRHARGGLGSLTESLQGQTDESSRAVHAPQPPPFLLRPPTAPRTPQQIGGWGPAG